MVPRAGHALRYASQGRRTDGQMVLGTVRENADIPQHAAQELRAGRGLATTSVSKTGPAAMAQAGEALLHASRVILANPEANRQASNAILQHASRLQAERKLILAADPVEAMPSRTPLRSGGLTRTERSQRLHGPANPCSAPPTSRKPTVR